MNKKSMAFFRTIRLVFQASPMFAALICLMKALQGILPAIYVVVYASFIDRILLFYTGDLALKKVLLSAVPILLLNLFQFCNSNLSQYLNLKCGMVLIRKEKLKFMQKCAEIPYLKIEEQEFQNLMYSTGDGIGDYIFSGFSGVLNCMMLALNVGGILAVICRYSWIAALIILICFVPIVMVSLRGGKDDYEGFVKYQEVERHLNSSEEILTSEKFSCERIVYGYAKWLIDRWCQQFDEATGVFLSIKRKSYTSIKAVSLCIKAILWCIIGIIIYLTTAGNVSIGICTMLVTQILAMSNRMTWELSAYLYDISGAGSYMQNYQKFYGTEPVKTGSKTVEQIESMEFRNVSFRYGEDLPYILKDLSFTMRKGQTYALVGENGAGKTTIMKLLLGLYDNYEGEIFINGQELRDIANTDKLFSVMFQDYAKYEISIRENVYMDDAEHLGEHGQSEDDRIIQWMETLGLDIAEQIKEHGLDTQVGRLTGENMDLSGGQWQRLAMIRALVHPGEFFILDEPTAALDPAAESAVYGNFRQMMQGRSALLITHRLGAARLADEILVLADGHVAEQGSHEELVARQGKYACMYEGQKGWYEN